mgnify:CR=1 FL=1
MKRFKKIALWILVLITLAVILLIIISPYKYHEDDFRTVEASIAINAPVDSVFAYMSNSDYASDWSSYVDHIEPLNSDKIPDGKKYSVRRVFVSKNEKEARWDEKIKEVAPGKLRRLSIYNIQGLAMSADGLLTEQRYKKVGANKTRLSLVLYFKKEHRGLWNGFKMHLGSFEIRSISEKNLVNIKREIEERWKK